MTFLDTGAMPREAPPWNLASITAMTRKARGYQPRAFALSAARADYSTTDAGPNKTADRHRLTARKRGLRDSAAKFEELHTVPVLVSCEDRPTQV